VLEEMPPFPERESSILAKLKRRKGPGNQPGAEEARQERERERERERSLNGSAEHREGGAAASAKVTTNTNIHNEYTHV
jgi:hypothetical protein